MLPNFTKFAKSTNISGTWFLDTDSDDMLKNFYGEMENQRSKKKDETLKIHIKNNFVWDIIAEQTAKIINDYSKNLFIRLKTVK